MAAAFVQQENLFNALKDATEPHETVHTRICSVHNIRLVQAQVHDLLLSYPKVKKNSNLSFLYVWNSTQIYQMFLISIEVFKNILVPIHWNGYNMWKDQNLGWIN